MIRYIIAIVLFAGISYAGELQVDKFTGAHAGDGRDLTNVVRYVATNNTDYQNLVTNTASKAQGISADNAFPKANTNLNNTWGNTQTFNTINLGGVARTNWLATCIDCGTASGSSLTNSVTFGKVFLATPKVTVTWGTNIINQVAVPEVISKTTSGFNWIIRTTAGLSTNNWSIDWTAILIE